MDSDLVKCEFSKEGISSLQISLRDSCHEKSCLLHMPKKHRSRSLEPPWDQIIYVHRKISEKRR